MLRRVSLAIALAIVAAHPLTAQADSAARARECASCAEWNAPQRPFRLYGNAFYVGTHGLGAVLLTSSAGHVLIDGALPESAAQIMASIRALGFRVEDVRLIVNSHAHFDHAGGIEALRRASGARVMASAPSARELVRGAAEPDDPQYGALLAYPAVAGVGTIADGDTLRVGSIALVAHFTPGHTPGGTSWTWRSCEAVAGSGESCLDFVYADSQTPVAADGFHFTASAAYPTALADFARGQAALESMRCDVLVTPHPSASMLWERVAARDAGDANALRDPEACRRFAATARRNVQKRVAEELAANGR